MKASQILAVAISGTCATAGASATAQYVHEQACCVRTHVANCISFGAPIEKLKQELNAVVEDAAELGWDGYGATPVTFETHEAARTFLDSLPLTMELPTVTAEPDGQISFEWYRSPSRLLSVSVSDEGKLYFAASIGPDCDNGVRVFCGAIPERITQLVTEVCTV